MQLFSNFGNFLNESAHGIELELISNNFDRVSRYELQEAVLDKDKQHDALMIELENLKLELQSVKNENKDLKNQGTNKMTGKGVENGKGEGDPKCCMEGLQVCT